MRVFGNGVPPSAMDKRYLGIAVEQAALAVKCKIESETTATDIDSIKQNDSENEIQLKEKFIDGILDSNKDHSKYCIEDAFEAVNAFIEDRMITKGYIKDLLMTKWRV